mgnify:CR=1 FL=1
MNNKFPDIKYKSHEGMWVLRVNNNDIVIDHLGESRTYDFDNIQDVVVSHMYVTLSQSSGSYYQVKFEEASFLVIDEYDSSDEFVGSVGSHVFGED